MSRQIDIKALISHVMRGDGSDKCRICLGDTTEGQVYLEDTVMIDGDKTVTLAELLENVTGVEVTEEPLFPISVCVACAGQALAAQEFRIFVRNSQKVWTGAVENLAVIPEEAVDPVKSMFTIITPNDLSLHMIKDYIGGEPKVVLNRFLNRLKSKPDKMKRTVRAGPTSDCPDCGKSFQSPYYLNMHLRNSGQKDACLVCGHVTIRGKEMRNHMFEVHGQTLFLCKKCPALLPTEAKCKTHQKKAHRSGALTCTDCGRTFPRAGSFDLHAQMHAVRTCRACGIQFSNRGCYREHRSQCEPNAKPDTENMPRSRRSNVRDPALFTCDYCGKIYSSRSQLKNHIIWIHMDVRPHQCQWCGKRFYTPSRLAEHTVVHTRVRNFACDICGVKLVSKMAAVYHRRRHTGEKPYECEECGERFISASRRLEHAKRKHNIGGRIQCLQCSLTFVRRYELMKHMNKAHKKDACKTE